MHFAIIESNEDIAVYFIDIDPKAFVAELNQGGSDYNLLGSQSTARLADEEKEVLCALVGLDALDKEGRQPVSSLLGTVFRLGMEYGRLSRGK